MNIREALRELGIHKQQLEHNIAATIEHLSGEFTKTTGAKVDSLSVKLHPIHLTDKEYQLSVDVGLSI